VRLLLRHKDIELDPRNPEDELTPLELARKEGYDEIVSLLLEPGAGQPKRSDNPESRRSGRWIRKTEILSSLTALH
jgi:ankyrin repeat protein